ncbi:hypothetical protein EB796_020550 [Bugula neritina]|uniref:Uncharacterized protein n=1 Tax=Bugula neritina TaxID=10212 RepID=A0A7J7J4M7_BUGNE|nr:hypothetical protein EB796_020550 [Bugula neritina]
MKNGQLVTCLLWHLVTDLYSIITDQTMKMTAPVVSSHSENAVFMSFMVPSEFSKNPPTPNDASVFIHRAPRVQFYVR